MQNIDQTFSEIPGTIYAINRLGEVRNKWGKMKSQFRNTCGYKVVYLMIDGKYKIKLVHRLLASVFIPNPDCLPIVDHIDRNIENNSLDNLRWATRSQNVLNSLRCINKKGGVYPVFTRAKNGKVYPQVKVTTYMDGKKICRSFKTIERAQEFYDSNFKT